MFGRKKAAPTEQIFPTIKAQTMPADFYGGLNPVVSFKKIEKEVVLNKKDSLTGAEKKVFDKATAVGSGEPLHMATIMSGKKTSVVFWIILFVFLLAGSAGYYMWQAARAKKTATPTPSKITVTIPVVTTTEQIVNSVSTTPDMVVTSTVATTTAAEVPIDFPSTLLAESADLDADGITDTAEDLFGTDPSKPDTDQDGYDDGHEVFYLYNPAGKEPMRLVESGLVKEYQNPVFGYALFYPNNWAVGNVDETYRQVLFSTLSGENIEVRVVDLLPGESFEEWFGRWAPQEKFANATDFQSRFFQDGKKRTDGLVYYFFDTSHVYVVLYHPTDSITINYKSVISMMVRSFGFSSIENTGPRPFLNL